MTETHEFANRDYGYTISLDPIVPPLSNGFCYEARLSTVVRRQCGKLTRIKPEPIGASGKTRDEALAKADRKVREWLDRLQSN